MAFARSGGLTDSGIVIEEFIPALSEHSAEVLIWNGDISVLCIGQKTKTPFPYRVDWSVAYPASLTTEEATAVAEMCRVAVSSLDLTMGVAHIEFAITAQGPLLIEVGARCGGGHTPQIAHHVSGVNEFLEACRMACGEAPALFVPTHELGADYRFLLFAEGTIAQVNIPTHIEAHPQVFDVAVTLQAGHEIKTATSGGLRVGYAVIFADTREEALSLGNEVCRQVTISYVDGQIHSAYTIPLRDSVLD
jgi:biotin carboxylase